MCTSHAACACSTALMILGAFGSLHLCRGHGGDLPVCKGWFSGASRCKADIERLGVCEEGVRVGNQSDHNVQS